MNTELEILEGAYKLIDEGAWIQGRFTDGLGGYCLSGAIHNVTKGRGTRMYRSPSGEGIVGRSSPFQRAVDALTEVIGWASRRPTGTMYRAARKEEVLGALRDAIEQVKLTETGS